MLVVKQAAEVLSCATSIYQAARRCLAISCKQAHNLPSNPCIQRSVTAEDSKGVTASLELAEAVTAEAVTPWSGDC